MTDAQTQTNNQQTNQLNTINIAAAQQKAAQAQQQLVSKQAAQAAYDADPSAANLNRLIEAAPDEADALQKGYQMMDAPRQQNLKTMFGQIYSSSNNQSPDALTSAVTPIIAAEKAMGLDTTDAQTMLDNLQSGDPAKVANAIKGAKAFSQMHLSAIDPKFAESLGIGGDSSKPFKLAAGETEYDSTGKPIASAGPKGIEPFHYTLKDASGTEHEYIYNPASGQPLPPGAVPAPGASGASALAPNGQLDPTAFYKQFVLPHEGGYAAHDANGAPVNHGVNQSANPDVDVKNLSADDAAGIFAKKYFPASANLPPALAAVNADTSFINPARAAQFLKASGGDPTKYMQLRQNWMNSLIQNQPDKYQPYAKAWATRNADLSAYAQNLGGGGSGASGAGTTPVSGGMPTPAIGGTTKIDPTPINNTAKPQPGAPIGDMNQTGDAFLATVPKGMQSTIKAIANYQTAAPKPGTKYGENLLEAVTAYDPTFDYTNAQSKLDTRKAFTGNGKAAQIGGSIGRLSYHLNDAYTASQALSGPDTGWAPLSNMLAGALQSRQQVQVSAYKGTLPFISGEVQKLVKNGAATEGEGNKIMANLAPNQPTDVRNTALATIAKLAEGAFKPYRDQWQSAFPNAAPPVDVSPESQTIFDHIINGKPPVPINANGKIIGADRSASSSAAPPVRVSTPAQARTLPPGTRFQNPDGRVFVR